jgi:DnaJ-class molecular chaperone
MAPRQKQPAKEKIKVKGKKTTHDINCSLREAYNGCTKHLTITRTVEGREIKEKLSIPIAPGLKEGARITYAEKGNAKDGETPGDVEFIFRIKKDPTFEWRDNDLVMTKKVSLYDALQGFTTTIQTIKGDEIEIKIPQLKNSGYEHKCAEYGMPIRRDQHNYGYGDLYVKFDIKLPSGQMRKDVLEII